jgi:hypothetical protein
MQAMVVMLIALGGLGCQNPASDVPPIPPAAGQPAAPSSGSVPAITGQRAAPSSESVPAVAGQPAAPSPASVPSYDPAPSAYPAYYGAFYDGGDPMDDDSFGSYLRDTFCSFFIGRSPDVPSARQIEAAYRAGYYGR